ncbi:MAG: hypothetical protein APR54_06180 [Candidatus Cloacimonas sp. SDB]|nr:MAG: hypothetical protein APR54_06180 [Candidatus Cloacimonas sp. SDB]
MNKIPAKLILLILVSLYLLTSCGHKKTATGGKVDNVKPEIVSIDPFELESLEPGKIEITFSKPIDRTSILSGIHIYPAILNKKFKWEGNTLTILILEELEEDTNYFFTFTSGIEGEHGNKLLKDYIYIFRNGKLNENRISGKIFYEKEADQGKQIKLILQAADSTFIYSRKLSGTAYGLDYLNAGKHILRAFIDNNKNNRYDYGIDAYFLTESAEVPIQTIDLEMAYEDTIKPQLIRAQVRSQNQIYLELSEPCLSYENIIVQTADSLQTELPVLASSLIENDLEIICQPLDTLSYNVILHELTDLKGNINPETAIMIDGITWQDSIPPEVIYSLPRNGATINTLKPQFTIRFSEILYSSDVEIELISNENNTSIEVNILQGNSEIFLLEPVRNLKNYSTYTLKLKAVDPNGNELEEDLELSFIPIIPE